MQPNKRRVSFIDSTRPSQEFQKRTIRLISEMPALWLDVKLSLLPVWGRELTTPL